MSVSGGHPGNGPRLAKLRRGLQHLLHYGDALIHAGRTQNQVYEQRRRLGILERLSAEQRQTVDQWREEQRRALEQLREEQRQALEQLREEQDQALAAARRSIAPIAGRVLARNRYFVDLALHQRLDPLCADLARRLRLEADSRPAPPAPLPPFADDPAPCIPANPGNDHLVTHPYTVLYVGPFAPAHGQHRLIDVLYALGKLGEPNLRLILAGEEAPALPAGEGGGNAPAPAADPEYADFLRRYAADLDLADQVQFLPAPSADELVGVYHAADLYLSLSLDEAGPPPPAALARVLRHDRLVLAYIAPGRSALADRLPPAARLDALAPDRVALAARALMGDAARRRVQLRAQRAWLPADPAASSDAASASRHVRIEGPFDSTYSLAVVNGEIALALRQRGDRVTLYNTDGYGDSPPDEDFLAAHPELDALRRTALARVDLTLRNLYPPRTQAMPGVDKIIGPYGWEESVFPAEWMRGFNRRLTAVLCMSEFVRRTLIDNGLTVPAFTTGLIADPILRHPPQDPGFRLPDGPRLLHVSSCFPRKGVDVLLEVLEELPPEVNLMVKTFPNPHNTVRARLAALGYAAHGAETAAVAHYRKGARAILLVEQDLPLGQVAWLYQQATLLAAPSRGEGFGLPMAEAMLLDLPVVTTDYGGQTDFCTPDTAWLVETRLVPARTHFALPGSQWAEPDPDSLRRAILAVLNATPEARADKTARARAAVRTAYHARAVVERIDAALRCLDARDAALVASPAGLCPSRPGPGHPLPLPVGEGAGGESPERGAGRNPDVDL